jgi:hypothetical protein
MQRTPVGVAALRQQVQRVLRHKPSPQRAGRKPSSLPLLDIPRMVAAEAKRLAKQMRLQIGSRTNRQTVYDFIESDGATAKARVGLIYDRIASNPKTYDRDKIAIDLLALKYKASKRRIPQHLIS